MLNHWLVNIQIIQSVAWKSLRPTTRQMPTISSGNEVFCLCERMQSGGRSSERVESVGPRARWPEQLADGVGTPKLTAMVRPMLQREGRTFKSCRLHRETFVSPLSVRRRTSRESFPILLFSAPPGDRPTPSRRTIPPQPGGSHPCFALTRQQSQQGGATGRPSALLKGELFN